MVREESRSGEGSVAEEVAMEVADSGGGAVEEGG